MTSDRQKHPALKNIALNSINKPPAFSSDRRSAETARVPPSQSGIRARFAIITSYKFAACHFQAKPSLQRQPSLPKTKAYNSLEFNTSCVHHGKISLNTNASKTAFSHFEAAGKSNENWTARAETETTLRVTILATEAAGRGLQIRLLQAPKAP